jgi:hypothetical protein
MTKEKFNEDGYIIIPSVIEHSVIDRIVDELYNNKPQNKNPNRITDAWREHDVIGYTAFNNKILNIITFLRKFRKPLNYILKRRYQ